MYKVYTSYFTHKIFKYWDKDYLTVPICSTLPKYYTYFTKWYRDLAPDPEILKQFKQIKSKTKSIRSWFAKEYLKKLKSLKEEGILDIYIKDLKDLVKYDDVFLLCYERPSQFCHRKILAAYLNKYYELDISEY